MATYKKKPKTVDLKPKTVTEDELKIIRAFVDTLNKQQMRVGNLEVQKKMMVDQIMLTQEQLYKNNELLKQTYGDVSVNIEDGTIKNLPKNENSN